MREGLCWLAGLKTRVRVGLLVIIVLGLPLSILYKGPACPLGYFIFWSWIQRKALSPRCGSLCEIVLYFSS